MSVIHILKDGSQVKDITGHVVKMSDAKELYTLLESINSKRSQKAAKQNTYEQK